MKNTKSVLVSVNFLVEVSDEELENENGELFKLENQLSEVHENLESPLSIDWDSTQTLALDPENMNCGICKSCGRWATDRESPKPLSQLCNGAAVEGKLLCDECLPFNHHWSF